MTGRSQKRSVGVSEPDRGRENSLYLPTASSRIAVYLPIEIAICRRGMLQGMKACRTRPLSIEEG